jgi:hypothetical protein
MPLVKNKQELQAGLCEFWNYDLTYLNFQLNLQLQSGTERNEQTLRRTGRDML